MKAMMTRWAGWFTDQKRQAVQALVASTVALLVILGAVSDVQSSALLDLSASALLVVQGALGLFLLRAGDRYTWLNTTGRGLIYSLGAAVGVAGFTFSLWSGETSSLIAQVATALASILVGAFQMVNAGTLTTPADPVDDDRLATVAESRAAEQADAARSIEASSATFAREKDSADSAPTKGLTVAVYDPRRDPLAVRGVTDAVRMAVAPEVVGRVSLIRSVDEARGLSFDVVFSVVPLTRAEAEVFVPCIAGSTYLGRRVASLS